MPSPIHSRRKGALPVLLCSSMAALALIGQSSAATAPYPGSTVITQMSWDFASVATMRKAHGSDLWPLTWAADGNLYGAWGDGGGFDGDSNETGRVSLGFARISGTPVAGEPGSYAGRNVWGAAPRFAENRATFGGKIDDLISIGGVLYGHGGLWTAANCGCPDPTHRSGDNPRERTLAWSSDLGKTWEVASWSTASDPGNSLQYGENYRGAMDPGHVYFYYQQDRASDATRIYLRRVAISQLTADPSAPGHFEYLAALDGEGLPLWSTSAGNALAIFEDPRVPPGTFANASVVYDAPLGRYLLATQHGDGAGAMGFFEAPAPWGPWHTVAYYDDWGGFSEGAGEGNGLSFPSKWISSDGKTLWGVFSGVSNGFDSFNAVRAILALRGDVPQIIEPVAGTELSPGERVSARGAGNQLSWSATIVGKENSVIATARGASLTFVVPENVTRGSLIRIALTGVASSVFRDYPVAIPNGNALAGYWTFNDGAGKVAKDSSASGNTGTLVNAPVWIKGKVREALDFRGGRAGVLVGSVASLSNLYRNGLTVMAWINPRSDGNSGRILDKDNHSHGWLLKMSNGGVQFVGDEFSADAVMRQTNRFLTRNAWQHVAATWDGSYRGSGVHLYVNGVPADGPFVNGGGGLADDSNIPLTIGNRLFDLERGFDGILDEVRIFDRVLTPAEIHDFAVSAAEPPQA